MIDSNKQLIYGKIPKKFYRVLNIQMILEPENQPEVKPSRILLKADEQFGFCVPPGTYQVKAVTFIDKDGNSDYVVDLPKLKLTIKENAANYIGDLYLNYCPEGIQVQDTLILPTKMGGRIAAGGLLFVIASELQGIIAIPRLFATFNDNFNKKGKQSLILSSLRFQKYQ